MNDTMVGKTETKQKIFVAAAQLFAQKGFRGVTMREIASTCGVTKPTIYYYFNNKEQIYKEIIKAGIEHGNADVNRIWSMPGLSLQQKLTELFQKRLHDCEQYPAFAQIFLRCYLGNEDLSFMKDISKAVRSESLQILVEMLQGGVEAGEIRRDVDLQMAAKTITAVFLYYLWELLESGCQVENLKVAEPVLSIIFTGLANKRIHSERRNI